MELPVLTPVQFLFGITLVGIVLLFCVYIPVQLAAKCRRMAAARTRLVCRICGYRFLRPEGSGRKSPCTCPHCGAHNH